MPDRTTEEGRERAMTLWQGDKGVINGHARYCVDPSHSLISHCSASADEPDTLLGGRSEAYKRDHLPAPVLSDTPTPGGNDG